MAIDSPVRWFHSGMANAPVLSGVAGALVSLLDACLIDGFDTKTINSISVASGVATATISGGHAYDVHAVVRVAGATPAALNGDWRITAATGSTLTFSCPGVADVSATGTMTAKRSPAGWAKPYAATNKAVYQSTNLASTRLFLRVDDADARYARARGYEQMTDVDTGAGLFPTLAQQIATNYTWAKSVTADAVARSWIVVSDDQFVQLLVKWTNSAGLASWYRFGDLKSFVVGDAYHAMISAIESASPVSASGAGARQDFAVTPGAGSYIARARSQAGGAIRVGEPGSALGAGSGVGFTTYPAGESYLHAPILVLDGTSTAAQIRGYERGVLQLISNKELADRAVITTGDKTLIVCDVSSISGAGQIAIDIVGPWG